MNAGVALGIVAVVVVGTILIGLRGVRGVAMDPQEYIVGGRRFGALLLWLLLAGEIYTTFTFLGAAGWAYGKGAPAYYILCYGTLAYVISFFLAPRSTASRASAAISPGRTSSPTATEAARSARSWRCSAS